MSLWSELKRRNVFRVGAAYVVMSWLLVQAADIMLDNFGAPEWVFKTVVALLVVGFPLAVFLAWVYELTPEGVKKSEHVNPAESIRPATGRKLDYMIIGVLALALSWFAWDKFLREPTMRIPETGTAPDRSIAVLPFVNMSADPEQEYFSDGLSEEILNLLAQIRDLKVIGRSSSFAFKGRSIDLREIGETLGVTYLLEGSVRKSGDELRITAQLIEVDGGSHLWSQGYDRRLDNVFAIQTEIATAIAEALRLSLVGPDNAPPEVQVAVLPAYERFLQARRLIQGRTRTGLEAARGLLDEALELDPDYAPAHAAAAQVMLLLADVPGNYGEIPLDRAVAAAQPLIDRALALDARLAEAHAVQGLLYNVQRKFAHSEAALERALDLNPSLSDALNWRAFNLGIAGRLREALAAHRRLAELDPLNLANLYNLSLSLAYTGEPEEAAVVAKRIQRGFPDSPSGFERQAAVQARTGRLAEARAPAERALALAPDSALAQRSIGSVSYALGDFDRVLALPAAYEHGPALLALGRIDEALTVARARAASAPDDINAANVLLYTLSLAGRHNEVLLMYHERWGDLAGLTATFAFEGLTRVLVPIAAAQRATGQHEELAETLRHWGEQLAYLREQGYDDSEQRFIEAARGALAGEHEDALTALTEAIDLGYRDPLLAIDPAFASLRDEPAFQAQFERNAALINAERAKLGMEPLP